MPPNHCVRSRLSPFPSQTRHFEEESATYVVYFDAVKVILPSMLRGVVARTRWAARGVARSLTPRILVDGSPGHDIPRKLCEGRCLEGVRGLHVSLAASKGEGRKEMLASMPRRDEGTEGEAAVSIDSSIKG